MLYAVVSKSKIQMPRLQSINHIIGYFTPNERLIQTPTNHKMPKEAITSKMRYAKMRKAQAAMLSHQEPCQIFIIAV